jgi:hypothetical protein
MTWPLDKQRPTGGGSEAAVGKTKGSEAQILNIRIQPAVQANFGPAGSLLPPDADHDHGRPLGLPVKTYG